MNTWIDRLLPDLGLSPRGLVRLRLLIGLVAAFLLLASQRIAALALIGAMIALDIMAGALARRSGSNIAQLDSAADRFTEFMLSACYLQLSPVAGIVFLALSTLNCIRSGFFGHSAWLNIPVQPFMAASLLFSILTA